MPYSYTNRKGVTYYLHRIAPGSRAGAARLVMKRGIGKGALDAVPPGCEVAENVNGQVSVRRIPRRVISEIEEEAVRAALKKHAREKYKFEIRGRRIVIYKPRTDADEHARRFSELAPRGAREAMERELREDMLRRMTYLPILRVTLENKERRTFCVERMCYRSSVDGWLYVLGPMPLAAALDESVPRLGRDSFFELW